MTTPIATTLGQLADAEPALARLAAAPLPIAAAYRVAKVSRAVAEELKYFHEQRNTLVRDHGTPVDGTDEIRVLQTSDKWGTFVDRVRELAAVPVTLTIAPLDLTTIPDLRMSPADLLLLGPLVADGEGIGG